MKHAEMIARLEAAEAGCAEMGREVLFACGWTRSVRGHFMGPLHWWSAPDRAQTILSGDEDKLPNVTTSLDAALALAERVLPDVQFNMATGVMGGLPWVQCYPFPQEEDNYLDAEAAATLPLALCIAILRALDATN